MIAFATLRSVIGPPGYLAPQLLQLQMASTDDYLYET